MTCLTPGFYLKPQQNQPTDSLRLPEFSLLPAPSSKNRVVRSSAAFGKIAYEQGFITTDELAALAAPLKKSGYDNYLTNA
ncbi:hypothetical protein IPL85_01805 [Candidatus Saccharibacteria bacterium]|nr:MAG: hypothetical protein IPL85_01805 [Candidatus Saccharibacteria bacterium]